MGERLELYSEETGRASEPLDVNGVLLCVGDNVKSTPDFHETERWVGVVMAVAKRPARGQRTYGWQHNPSGIEVCARLYVQGVAGRGEVATLYSSACLWERTSAAADVSDDETFT